MEMQDEQSTEFPEDPTLEEDENVKEVLEPKVGMIFDSEVEALQYYATYAKGKGFGAMIRNNKKREDGVKCHLTFACHRSRKPRQTALNPLKPHPTAKTDCKASMNISLQFDGKWRVNSIVVDHNHEMDPKIEKYLESNRTRVHPNPKRPQKLNKAAGIRMNKTINPCVIEAGGVENLTRLEKDARNYIDKVKHLQLKEGDAKAMVQYFVKMQKGNGDFFYAIDLDEDNQLRNVFWADARSRESYKEFGDVVTFDTTCLVNRFDMPFVSFVGANHHGQSILFGCGLVSPEDTASFVWLFQAWLSCMSDRCPNAIITDQCRAMQNAISQVCPSARHRWCLWHIMTKISENLKGNNQYKLIKDKLKDVVYDSFSPQEFEESWANLIKAYDLQNNDWLGELYEQRHRWVPTFVKDTFWAGMSTTQRSESINAFFDGYIHSNTTLKEFVEQYENILRQKVQEEEEEDARCFNLQIQNVSPYEFENQFQQAYTLEKCKQFREQVAGLIGCNLTVGPVVDGISQFFIDQHVLLGKKKIRKHFTFLVHFNEETRETNCNCQLFESKGIVCAHMMSVWGFKNVDAVLEKYILQRWRKNLIRSHTKVRVSYSNWECKPEWHRYDVLLKLFNKCADQVMYSDKKTNWMAGILKGIIAENDVRTEECLSNLHTSIHVRNDPECSQEKSTSMGDSSIGPQIVRPSVKRKESLHEQIARRNNKKVQHSHANENNMPGVDVEVRNIDTPATDWNEIITQESSPFRPSQRSASDLGLWSYDVNESPLDWGS